VRWAVVRVAYLRARGVAEGRARRSEDGGGGGGSSSDGETDALSCDLMAFHPLAGSARTLGRIGSCYYEASARKGVTTN